MTTNQIRKRKPRSNRAVNAEIQRVPLEKDESIALVQWMDLSYHEDISSLLVHIKNEGRCSWHQGKIYKAMGVRKDFLDYVFFYPSGIYHGLVIELKRTKHYTVTAGQKNWVEKLNKRGYMALICYGAEEAIRAIKYYLSLDTTG